MGSINWLIVVKLIITVINNPSMCFVGYINYV